MTFNIAAQFRATLYGEDTFGRVYSLVWQFFLAFGNVPLDFPAVRDDLGEVLQEIADSMSPFQSDEFMWSEYGVQTLNGNQVSGKVALATPAVGDIADEEMLPAQTALGVSCATGVSRRILKKYVPGLTVSALNDAGNWTSTIRSNFLTVAEGWTAVFEETEAGWLWSHNPSTVGDNDNLTFPLTVTIRSEPHVQRRRRLDA